MISAKINGNFTNYIYSPTKDFSTIQTLEDMGFNNEFRHDGKILSNILNVISNNEFDSFDEATQLELSYDTMYSVALTGMPYNILDSSYASVNIDIDYNTMLDSSEYGVFDSNGKQVYTLRQLEEKGILDVYSVYSLSNGCELYSMSISDNNESNFSVLVIPENVIDINISQCSIDELVVKSNYLQYLDIRECSNLQTVLFNNNIQTDHATLNLYKLDKLVHINSELFHFIAILECHNLVNLDLSNAIIIERISDCENLEKVYLSEKLLYTYQNLFTKTKLYNSFEDIVQVNGILVYMDEFNGNLLSGFDVIPTSAFNFTSDINELTIDDCKFILGNLSIAFPKLTKLELSNHCEWIGPKVFSDFNQLEEVILYDGIVAIGSEAFCNTPKLQTVPEIKMPIYIGKDIFKNSSYNPDVWSEVLLRFDGTKTEYSIGTIVEGVLKDYEVDTLTINPSEKFLVTNPQFIKFNFKTLIINGDVILCDNINAGKKAGEKEFSDVKIYGTVFGNLDRVTYFNDLYINDELITR